MKITIANSSEQTFTGGEPYRVVGPDHLVEPRLIKRQELARRLSVSVATIDHWMAKRMIPYIQIRPRFYLFDFEEVVAALKKAYQIEARER